MLRPRTRHVSMFVTSFERDSEVPKIAGFLPGWSVQGRRVYRAKDNRLDREVAVTVLPDQFSN